MLGVLPQVWDNTSSWIKSRTVIRTIDVVDGVAAAASAEA
jgi:hypothetical protein